MKAVLAALLLISLVLGSSSFVQTTMAVSGLQTGFYLSSWVKGLVALSAFAGVFILCCFFWQVSAAQSARGGVQRLGLWTGAWSTVEYAVRSASVCLLGLMGTNMSALVTGTRRTQRARQNALKLNQMICMYLALQIRVLVMSVCCCC